ncbi:lytic transglycosylase domain-containing protein [Alphaproteobacteria bacterium]|nr:lytic transglycosylase domain-containing protein [Alphaproteobacteria bacterium]
MIDPYGYGYLSQYSNAVTPPLLNLFMQNETGHLSMKDRFDPIKSRSPKGAIGGYQFMPNHLSDLGYKLPPYTVKDALDPNKSRDIAGKFIKGYSDHYGFNNVADTLIGYNMGARATRDWKNKGSKLEDLPDETKAYLKRAMSYIKNNPDQYSLEKINQEIAEVSNDNQEGTNGMFNYANPNAENFYDPRQRENILGNDLDYQAKKLAFNRYHGINDPILEQQIAQSDNNNNPGVVNGRNQQFEEVNIDPRVQPILYGNGGDGGLFANQQAGVYGDYSSNINVPELDGVIAPSQVANNTSNGLLTSSANASTLYDNENLVGQDNPNGVLSSNFLSRPAATEKRRDRQDLSKGVRYPEDIGLNEMLIRIGGAGQANGQLGGNRQIADATAMYGNIMDYNRGQALAKYKVDMANAKKTAKQARADQDYIGNIDQSLADMDKALAGLKSVDGNIFTGITGLWDGTVGSFLDSMTGDPKATTRLLLKKLKVDDTLLRIAQTKGAISNKEMDLFMSPAPSVGFDNEEIWKTWINERKVALQRIKSRLTGNMQVVNNQQASSNQVNSFVINGQTVTVRNK